MAHAAFDPKLNRETPMKRTAARKLEDSTHRACKSSSTNPARDLKPPPNAKQINSPLTGNRGIQKKAKFPDQKADGCPIFPIARHLNVSRALNDRKLHTCMTISSDTQRKAPIKPRGQSGNIRTQHLLLSATNALETSHPPLRPQASPSLFLPFNLSF